MHIAGGVSKACKVTWAPGGPSDSRAFPHLKGKKFVLQIRSSPAYNGYLSIELSSLPEQRPILAGPVPW